MLGQSLRATKTVAPNSPTEIANANPAATPSARSTSGRSTSRQTRAGEAPSTAAASRSCTSIERSAGATMRTTNGAATSACTIGTSHGEARSASGGSSKAITNPSRSISEYRNGTRNRAAAPTFADALGFGFVIAFDDPPLELRGSPWLVPIVQALVAAPFVVRIVAPALRSIDEQLREAAAVLGASPARVWREVDLPLVLRALGVAAGFAFAFSLGEFGATVFVARSDWPTVPVAIFRFLSRPGAINAGQAAALGVILMVLTAATVLVADRVTARRGVL